MRLASSFIILTSFIVAGFSAPNAGRTVDQVKADIATITTQVNALDSAIRGFPTTGGTITQAPFTPTPSTGPSLNTATTDVKNMPPASDTDGRAIISSIQAIEPTILDALKGITAKKAAFQALPVDGITTFIRQDLANLGASTSAFESALIASAPASLLSQAQQLKASVNAAFATAVAAYA